MFHRAIVKRGDKYGRLTILSETYPHYTKSGTKIRIFECLCDCGRTVDIRLMKMRSGHTKSCGCLKKDTQTTHGLSDTPEYRSYVAMMNRCTKSEDVSFKNYGGRGIKVCDKWKKGFEYFFEDMGHRPNGTTLDRIDSEGNYSKENCRWADADTQFNNKRNSRFLTHKGKRQTISQWARELSMERSTIQKRIDLYNFSVKRALQK